MALRVPFPANEDWADFVYWFAFFVYGYLLFSQPSIATAIRRQGWIALGHPFGMAGARIMTTLLNGLQTADKTLGLETMCVAGGQGMAMIVERLS
jgi:Thiolase, C-terminal domain